MDTTLQVGAHLCENEIILGEGGIFCGYCRNVMLFFFEICHLKMVFHSMQFKMPQTHNNEYSNKIKFHI